MKIINLKTVYKIEGVPSKITYRRKTYDFGLWDIRIKKAKPRHIWAASQLVTFKSCDNKDHPHIGRDGSACLGNIDNLVLTLHSLKEYDQIADLLVKFLNSYNARSPITRIECCGKYCRKCYQLTTDCECS